MIFSLFKKLFGNTKEDPLSDFMEQQEKRLQAAQDRIEKQQVSVAAIHRVSITESDIQKHLQLDPHWTSLTLDYLLDITKDLFLIDVKTGDIGVIDIQLSDVTQDNEHGQAPFAERYFDKTGKKLLVLENDYDHCPPDHNQEPGHVRFYMHYFDPDMDLEFGGKMLRVPKPTPFPDWLRELMPYRPPD
jgi:hypothetical protein